MSSKLKRDQIPNEKAINWRKSLKKEKKLTFNLKISEIVLQKETYKILAGENENRIRIYLGLEPIEKDGTLKLCAYAVASFLLGSGDVYADYETPVYKLEKQNLDYSKNTDNVLESIRRYRSWRLGKIKSEVEGADVRKYIYPNAFLFTKYELHEIFNVQDKKEALIEFGISKRMNAMISPVTTEASLKSVKAKREAIITEIEIYNEIEPCPPYCDDGSPYNT